MFYLLLYEKQRIVSDPFVAGFEYEVCCLGKNQTTFRVQDTSKEKRMCKVPCEQVFDEMFNGKIEKMKTGNLKYIWVEKVTKLQEMPV